MSKLTRDATTEPSRETKLSGANGDKEMSIFPVQLTSSRIGNLTRLIHTFLHVMNINCTYKTVAPVDQLIASKPSDVET